LDVVERDGHARFGGEGRPLERAVWMRRLPAEGMLSALLARDAVRPALIRRLARLIARFHVAAPTGPEVDQHGSLGNVEAHNAGNFREVEPYVDVTIPRWELAAIQAYAERTLRERRELFEHRVA